MIKIKNLSKEFRVYKRRMGMIKQVAGFAKEGRDYETVHSLNNINLEVPSGKVHGIIGMNGAGKSTLLKILTGVLDPTSGTLEMSGRIAALLELGTGFHGELTGRENVYMNGSIMGFSKEEVDEKMPAIMNFAELGDFFDRPVKIYSSGMYVRLAFSYAVSVEPDILIIDEALSVGDAYFQQKCLKKIRQFKDKGTTILFVSHDLGAVRMLCEEVTLLSKGDVLFNGSPMQALDLYNGILAEHQNEVLAKAKAEAVKGLDFGDSYESGSHEVKVTESKMLDAEGKTISSAVSGDVVEMVVRAKVYKGPMTDLTCGILIRDRLGYDVFGTNTHNMNIASKTYKKDDELEFRFKFKLNLGSGDYTLTVALHSDRSHVDANYHWVERALIFKVLPSLDFEFVGVSRLEPVCQVNLL